MPWAFSVLIVFDFFFFISESLFLHQLAVAALLDLCIAKAACFVDLSKARRVFRKNVVILLPQLVYCKFRCLLS